MFNPENTFWKMLTKISDMMGLSICWLICSLPLITAGAATAALYDAVVHCIRGNETIPFTYFFRGLKRNFAASLLPTLFVLVLELLLSRIYAQAYVLAASGDKMGPVMLILAVLLMCIPLAVWLLAMPMISQMELTWRQRLVYPVQAAFHNLTDTALITMVTVLAVLFTSWILFFILITPALAVVVISYPVDRILKTC